MFSTSNTISPITQAEVAYRADRVRRDFAGSRRRRRSHLPFFGESTGTASKRTK